MTNPSLLKSDIVLQISPGKEFIIQRGRIFSGEPFVINRKVFNKKLYTIALENKEFFVINFLYILNLYELHLVLDKSFIIGFFFTDSFDFLSNKSSVFILLSLFRIDFDKKNLKREINF